MLNKRKIKLKRNVIASILSLCLTMVIGVSIPNSVMAAFDAKCEYDSSTEKIKVHGNGVKARGLITLVLLPANVDLDDAMFSLPYTEENEPEFVLKTIQADKLGEFSTEFVLQEWLRSNDYKLHIVSNGERNSEFVFNYVNPRKSLELLERINGASESQIYTPATENTEASGILYENPLDMGTNLSDISLWGTLIAKNLVLSRPTNGYSDVISMVEAVQQIIVWKKIAAAPISSEDTTILTKEKIIENNDSIFGIDYDLEFKNLSSKTKESFYEMIENWSENVALKDSIMQSLIFTQVKKSVSYTAIKDVVLYYKDYLNLDLTKYDRLNAYQKGQVFSIFANKGVNGFDEIDDRFNESVSAAANLKEPITNNNGSGGGGGGGGTRIPAGNVIVTEKPSVQGTDNPQSSVAKVFSDIENHWSKAVVEELSKKKIISGYEDGSFRPDNKVTRAEFAKLVVSTLELKEGNTCDFEDVSNDDWFFDSVCIATENGLISGYNGMFNPNTYISRQDAAVILYRGLVAKGMITESSYEFVDDSEIAEYAKTAVESLADNKILNGFEGRFSPLSNATRGETAQMLYNILQFLSERGGI